MALSPIILDELATNRGVIDRPIKPPTGASIPYVVRNLSGDWDPFLPAGEKQFGKEDSMACVSFALLNCIEAQEFFLTGKRINYSDRWLAKLSNTQRNGNYLQTVADTVSDFGLVKESSWPAPANYTWSQYYAEPTANERAALLAEGQEWKETHKFEFGFIQTLRDELLKYILQAPIQIVIPGHSVMNFFSAAELVKYFDTYEPFKKQTNRSSLTDAARAILTMKNMIRLIDDNGTIYLIGDTGRIGLVDMKALETIKKLDSAPIEKGSTEGTPVLGMFESGLTFHK